MIDLMRHILTHFWPFVGACILISCVCTGVAEIVKSFRGRGSS